MGQFGKEFTIQTYMRPLIIVEICRQSDGYPNRFNVCVKVLKEAKTDSEIIQFRKLPVIERAVCIEHVGSYENFDTTVVSVFEYLERNNLKVMSEPRFSYIHGIWDRDRESDWLTEIQIPIE